MFQFADSWDLIPVLTGTVAPDDPLAQSDFFKMLAGKLEHINDPDGFDLAYEESVAALPEELRENMPGGYDRKVLRALCADPEFLRAWAWDHSDVGLMFDLGPTVLLRWLIWPPHWWPVNLLIYIPLAIAFLGGSLAQVYGQQVVEPVIQIGLFLALVILCLLMAIFSLLAFSLLMVPIAALAKLATHLIDRAGDVGRLTTIERTRAKRIKREGRNDQPVTNQN